MLEILSMILLSVEAYAFSESTLSDQPCQRITIFNKRLQLCFSLCYSQMANVDRLCIWEAPLQIWWNTNQPDLMIVKSGEGDAQEIFAPQGVHIAAINRHVGQQTHIQITPTNSKHQETSQRNANRSRSRRFTARRSYRRHRNASRSRSRRADDSDAP